MKCQTSSCSFCRHYTPTGRRGGQCALLSAPVRGQWRACSLALPAFMTPLSAIESLEKLQTQALELSLNGSVPKKKKEVLEAQKEALEVVYSA